MEQKSETDEPMSNESMSNENRPQISVKANDVHKYLVDNQIEFQDTVTKQYERKKITIMDESLNTILDKLLNFVVYSVDDYSEALDNVKSELPEDSIQGATGSLKLHMFSFLRFCQIRDNLIYIGILCVILSIIIYFLHITILG